jgi:hypothetical protein
MLTFGDCAFEAPADSRLGKLCLELKEEFPEVKFRHKRKVWYHWIAHVAICILTVGLNRRYISGFTTTSKNYIDWSDAHWERLQTGKDLDRVWECFRHEREHLRQFRKYTRVGMVLLWSIPPILLCYGRAILIEKPGYLESLRAKLEVSPGFAKSTEYKKWWVGQFTGFNYGLMWILKWQVERWFDDEVERYDAD